MIHVGMDLHRNNCLVVAICDQTGERFPARRIDHDRIETLWQYLDQFQGDPPIRVVLEATGNSRWMARLLDTHRRVEPVVVVPHKVRDSDNMRGPSCPGLKVWAGIRRPCGPGGRPATHFSSSTCPDGKLLSYAR